MKDLRSHLTPAMGEVSTRGGGGGQSKVLYIHDLARFGSWLSVSDADRSG